MKYLVPSHFLHAESTCRGRVAFFIILLFKKLVEVITISLLIDEKGFKIKQIFRTRV